MKTIGVCLGACLFFGIVAVLPAYDTSPAHLLLLPECIWATATGGGTWVTELQISSMTSGTTVSMFFYYGTGYRSVPNVWVGAGLYESMKSSNILALLQTLDPSFTYTGRVGTLQIMTQDDDHRIQAVARTVNGNYGKTYPCLPWIDSCTANVGRAMIIMNLTQNAAYRTFVGCWNGAYSAHSMSVQFTIVNQNNATVGTPFSKNFGSWEFKSFNPFVEAGASAGTYDNCWLYINPTSCATSSRGLLCYGSSANNYTNDSCAHLASMFQ